MLDSEIGTSNCVEGSPAPGCSAFIGRKRELAELGAGLRAVHQGRGGLYLIVGDPGIGKSSLAAAVADDAQSAGMLVLTGRCWEGGGAPAFWPWVQVLRECHRAADGDKRTVLDTTTADIALLVPELHDAASERTAASRDPERARFQLFDAVACFLASAARARPLVLVLDDLHAADHPSLLLLQFLGRQLASLPILVVGCYRPFEMRRRFGAADFVGELASQGRHLRLGGLSAIETALLIERSSGRTPPPNVVSAVHSATGGNPFFVDEISRLLAIDSQGWSLHRQPMPDGVRETIRRRLYLLSSACIEVLAAAALLGQEFDVACLERACALPHGRFFDLLD